MKENFAQLFSYKLWWIIASLFWLYIISGWWSTNLANWGEAVRIHLPFIALPFVFLSHEKISKKTYLFLHSVFVGTCVIAAFIVLFQYVQDFSDITESIKKGQAIPTPFSRPNFSVVIAFGMLITLAMDIDPNIKIKNNHRWILRITSAFLLLFLHILSVRSGLLAAYIGIFILGMYWIYLSKNYIIGIGLAFLMVCIPVISYFTIPSFKNKVDYSYYDLKRYTQGTGDNYSDSERLYSIEAGWNVFIKDPVLGCGAGDLRHECMKYYRANDIQMLKFKYPHNQFVYILAALGLLGFLIFVLSIYSPLFLNQNYYNIYMICLYLSITVLFLVESPLGRSNMVAFYLLFLLLGLRLIRPNKMNEIPF